MSKNKADEKQSFITEARRAQIIDAAITTLDEIGYVNASLAQIAKRAGISTSLISFISLNSLKPPLRWFYAYIMGGGGI